MLELLGCSAYYNSLKVLHGISLTLKPGDTAAIVGPSGCGKTTLLLLLAGLKSPGEGTVTLDGEAPLPGNRKTGLVLQQYGLFSWMTAEANVGIGLKLKGVSRRNRVVTARRALTSVGLQGLEKRYPGELSGGERQRIALARVLALSPRLLLLDEPFSSLDALTRERLQDLLLSLLAPGPTETGTEEGADVKAGISVLVTHSVEEAVYLGTRIFLMSPKPGTLVKSFSNPLRGRPGWRTEDSYFALCREVRRAMENYWRD